MPDGKTRSVLAAARLQTIAEEALGDVQRLTPEVINWIPAERGQQAPDAGGAKRNKRRLRETADALVRGTSVDGRRLRGEFTCTRPRIRVRERPRLI